MPAQLAGLMQDVESTTRILRLARAQHGIVARWQLAGDISLRRVSEFVRHRRLQSVARGVYLIPGLEGPRVDLVAAVLFAGPGAVASHETAGEVQELVSQGAQRLIVSISRGHPRHRDGIVYRRVRLAPDERSICDGVPVTSLARTLLDLSATLPERSLEQALARGLREDETREQLVRLLERYPSRPGTPRLRAILSADTPPAMARSEAEERFLALVRTAQLPPPLVNIQLRSYEVDFFWRAHKLVVEIDGLAYHTSRAAQQRDRQRDTALGVAGIRVLRFTWHDLTRMPEATIAKVALALGHARV